MDMRVFLVLFSLLYVGLVRFVIRLKYIPVAAVAFLSTLNYNARSTTHQMGRVAHHIQRLHYEVQ